MTPQEMERLCKQHINPRWQTILARLLGLNARTIRRYATGELPFPEHNAMLLMLLIEQSMLQYGRQDAYCYLHLDNGFTYPSLTDPAKLIGRRVKIYAPSVTPLFALGKVKLHDPKLSLNEYLL